MSILFGANPLPPKKYQINLNSLTLSRSFSLILLPPFFPPLCPIIHSCALMLVCFLPIRYPRSYLRFDCYCYLHLLFSLIRFTSLRPNCPIPAVALNNLARSCSLLLLDRSLRFLLFLSNTLVYISVCQLLRYCSLLLCLQKMICFR